MYELNSRWGAVVGFAVALVAIIGTVGFNWEWGSGQLVPTIIGVGAAILALVVVATRLRS